MADLIVGAVDDGDFLLLLCAADRICAGGRSGIAQFGFQLRRHRLEFFGVCVQMLHGARIGQELCQPPGFFSHATQVCSFIHGHSPWD